VVFQQQWRCRCAPAAEAAVAASGAATTPARTAIRAAPGGAQGQQLKYLHNSNDTRYRQRQQQRHFCSSAIFGSTTAGRRRHHSINANATSASTSIIDQASSPIDYITIHNHELGVWQPQTACEVSSLMDGVCVLTGGRGAVRHNKAAAAAAHEHQASYATHTRKPFQAPLPRTTSPTQQQVSALINGHLIIN